MRVSVVTVTRNAESLIDKCLSSVKWADELIVVDAGSQDQTLERARAYTPHVYVCPGVLHDRVLWNEGLNKSTADWIILLESDQRAPASFEQEVRSAIKQSEDFVAFRAPTKNLFLGYWLKSCGCWPDEKVYLLRHGSGFFEDREEGILIVNGPIGDFASAIEHLSYRSLTQAVEKINAHTSGIARALAEEPGQWRTRFLITKPWRAFKKAYLRQGGRQDGLYGLVYALLLAFTRYLVCAKRWEYTRLTAASACDTDMGVSLSDPAIASGKMGSSGSGGLTVLLITKNEESRLAGCLESVRWASEIVVVDGCSTDRTREIAASYGAKVITRPFSGSFAEERNAGLDIATGDWVIQMDADERVSPGLRLAIERLLENSDETVGAYQVRRKNFFLGHFMRYGGWYHRHLCLFRRAGSRYDGLVHERLSVSGSVGMMEVDLEHYPFDSITQFVDRQNRYTLLQARELGERGCVSEKVIRHNLTVRPLKLFWKLYIKKQAFRDGVHGLVFSCLYAWVHVLMWAKYWEHSCVGKVGGSSLKGSMSDCRGAKA